MVDGPQDFDRSWLRKRVSLPDYFSQQLQSRLAARDPSFRQEVEQNRDEVLEAWQDGDELWYWRMFIDGNPSDEEKGLARSGADGLAILRAGEVARVWLLHRIL